MFFIFICLYNKLILHKGENCSMYSCGAGACMTLGDFRLIDSVYGINKLRTIPTVG